MDDFGTIPNAPGFARYMAKQRSDGTWCVWDYRDGKLMHTGPSEATCRAIAQRWSDDAFLTGG